MSRPDEERAQPCGVEHDMYDPCDLPAGHRGAHRSTRVVPQRVYDWWGTNEPGFDPQTGVPIGSSTHPPESA